LRSEQLPARPGVSEAYAASVSALVAVITEMVRQTAVLEEQGECGFGQHPDAEIYLSQPRLGVVPGARVLAEFGDDPHRYADARATKNYSGMAPIPALRAPDASCSAAAPATDGSPTPSTSRPSPRPRNHPEPELSTTDTETAAPPTTKPYEPSRTASSAFCTAVWPIRSLRETLAWPTSEHLAA
jgi:hypothetical protein